MKPFELTEDQKTMVSNYAAAHAAFHRYYGLMLQAELYEKLGPPRARASPRSSAMSTTSRPLPMLRLSMASCWA